MKPFAEEVVRQALSLDETDRAEVAARLLDSLEETDSETEDAWVAELERRAAELESGAVRGVSWEDLRERLMRGRRTRKPLIFHPEAAHEAEEAQGWYRGRRTSLNRYSLATPKSSFPI
jgi:putative addiction module component (TIGR02574 family)